MCVPYQSPNVDMSTSMSEPSMRGDNFEEDWNSGEIQFLSQSFF